MEEKRNMDYSNMSIYKKIQFVKNEILKANLKKSGVNKFSGFTYYELSDFTPTIVKLCEEVGLFTKFTYTNEVATLIIINSDKPEQKEEYTSPMRDLQLKGCNDIQALGGVETYSRRYLYMSAFDIIENDMFDPATGDDKNESVKPKEEKKASPKQVEILANYYSGENLNKLLTANGITNLNEMPLTKASELIKKISEKRKEQENGTN